jgi:predicted dehydrogenase
VHGTKGTIIFEQERLNELRLFTPQDDPATDGFRTILTGPQHPPYAAFLPNGGHSLGYMDVKICELHELLQAIDSNEAVWPSFADGLVIEKVMDAVDRSALSGSWEDV